MNAPARPRPQRRRAVRREQLSDEVATRLRSDIMTGTLRPGTFIRLDETAAALGVSITPVREALRTLRGEGMVQLEPHRGHVVVALSRGDIEDIFWLQATIARSSPRRRPSGSRIRRSRSSNGSTMAWQRRSITATRRRSSRRSSRFTGHSTVPPAGSNWHGSCCTSRGTCRGRSMPATRYGVPRRSPRTTRSSQRCAATMLTPQSGSPAVSSPTPHTDWSPGSTRSGSGPEARRELRACGQPLGAGLEVVGQIIQGVGDRLLHHRLGEGQLGLDIQVDGQQRSRADGHTENFCSCLSKCSPCCSTV